jgi:hypothetical protein
LAKYLSFLTKIVFLFTNNDNFIYMHYFVSIV